MKKHIIWIIVLFSLVLAPNSSALCCGNACYPGGTCDTSVQPNKWYSGCLDDQGVVQKPGTNLLYSQGEDVIASCTYCKCDPEDASDCSWQLSSTACRSDTTPDLVCSAAGSDYEAFSKSKCVDRDDATTLCKSSTCDTSKPISWLSFGEKADQWNTFYQPDASSPQENIQGCCGDDSSEFIIETTIASVKYSSCCNKNSDCVDANSKCQTNIQEAVETGNTCTDGLDNDCDGLIDTADDGCCGDADNAAYCCPGADSGAWDDASKCCGDDDPEDYGKVTNGKLCVKDSTEQSKWVSTKGMIYQVGNYDIVVADKISECNSEADGPSKTEQSLVNMQKFPLKIGEKSHDYICYSQAVTTTQPVEPESPQAPSPETTVTEVIAECKGKDETFFSSSDLGGQQHSTGSTIMDKNSLTKLCCDDAQWHDNEDIGVVPACNSVCESAGGTIAFSGEPIEFGSYTEQGQTGCCGDVGTEFFEESTNYNRHVSDTAACCKTEETCVYDGKCHKNSSAGGRESDTSCYDQIDNDCDDTYDFSTSLPDLIDPKPQIRIDNNYDPDCVITLEGTIVDSGDPIGTESELIISGTFNQPYDGKQPKFTYSTIVGEDGKFSIQVNADSHYDLTVLAPGFEPKVITKTFEYSSDPIQLPPIELGVAHQYCNSDCTNRGNNLCNKECDSRYGSTPHQFCNFSGEIDETNADDVAKVRERMELCHERRVGHTINISSPEDVENWVIECCESKPFIRREVKAVLATEDCDVIRTTKIVTLYGKPIRMVIDSLSCAQ